MNEYADAVHTPYTPVKKENIQGEARYSYKHNLHRYDKPPDRSLKSSGARP